LLQSWAIRRHTQTPTIFYDNFEPNDQIVQYQLEKYSGRENEDQVVEIDIEVGANDVANMAAMKADSLVLNDYASKNKFQNVPLSNAQSWDLDGIREGQVFTYRILNNGSLSEESASATHFRQYLSWFEIDSKLRSEAKLGGCRPPSLICQSIAPRVGSLQVYRWHHIASRTKKNLLMLQILGLRRPLWL